MKPKTIQLSVKLPAPMVRRLDRVMARNGVVGARFTRASVMRDLIQRHVEENERAMAPDPMLKALRETPYLDAIAHGAARDRDVVTSERASDESD